MVEVGLSDDEDRRPTPNEHCAVGRQVLDELAQSNTVLVKLENGKIEVSSHDSNRSQVKSPGETHSRGERGDSVNHHLEKEGDVSGKSTDIHREGKLENLTEKQRKAYRILEEEGKDIPLSELADRAGYANESGAYKAKKKWEDLHKK